MSAVYNILNSSIPTAYQNNDDITMPYLELIYFILNVHYNNGL